MDTTMLRALKYAHDCIDGVIPSPRYVKKQCKEFIQIAEDKHKVYTLDKAKAEKIDKLLGLIVMAKGLKVGSTVKETLAGFQALLIIGSLCTVYRDNPQKRRYENVVLEIARKNGKTAIIAILFILLLFLEPRFSKFYSVAPDGSLSREVKNQIQEFVSSSSALCGEYNGKLKFKMLRDVIKCQLTDNEYIPLNYSTSRLDGKLPSVFLVDETGALPVAYPLEAMRSGQLTILNKLGFVISTKYPTQTNPFEDEVAYCKKVLDGTVDDETVFSLLYEPDETKNWADDDVILEHANPLALEVPQIWEDLLKKRKQAIEMPTRRENFLTKHCNIIYSGSDTESFCDVGTLKKCAVDKIDWRGRDVYVGFDLSMSVDNTAVAMCSYDKSSGKVYFKATGFIPSDKIDEKTKLEKVDYRRYIKEGLCIPCGDNVIDYSVIENHILNLEKTYGVNVVQVGFDPWNARSTAQKLEQSGLQLVEIKQHSSLLHPPTKWLSELIADERVEYVQDGLFELNVQNARCTYDTNMNRYVTKKKSSGKIDELVALINAMYLLQQNVILEPTTDWAMQF